MTDIHMILLVVVHYGYDAVIELFVDFGDHFVTHIVLVWVIKAGVVRGVFAVVKRVRIKHRKTSSWKSTGKNEENG